MNRTFGPNALPLLAAVLGVALVFGGLFALPHLRGVPMAIDIGVCICLGFGSLAASVFGWCWYRLDDAGIWRFGLCRSRFVAWDDVGGVPGRTVDGGASGVGAFTSHVVDHEGFRLMRLGPWIRGRMELVRFIRDEVAARRKS